MSESLDLDTVEARANAATLGPWTVDIRKGDPSKAMVYRRYEFFGPQTEIVTLDIEVDDAEFIAHARTDIPLLVARVRELEAALLTAKGDGWDEACMALAWAIDNGPTESAAAYVAANNPYRHPTQTGQGNG